MEEDFCVSIALDEINGVVELLDDGPLVIHRRDLIEPNREILFGFSNVECLAVIESQPYTLLQKMHKIQKKLLLLLTSKAAHLFYPLHLRGGAGL